MAEIPTLDELARRLASGRTSRIIRFLLNVASSTPYVGGVFSAAAAAWSEREQQSVNRLIASLQRITDDRVTELDGDLVSLGNSALLAAARVTFNPNTAKLSDGWNVSSLTENGKLDFVFTFTRPVGDLVFSCYGSGPVSVTWAQRGSHSLGVVFDDPAPDQVRLVAIEAAA